MTITDTDRATIEAAVAEAEKKTAGEIVPMIVRQSSYVSHVPMVVGLLVFSLLMLLIPEIQWLVSGPLWAFDIGALVISVALAVVLSRVPAVQRIFTPAKDSAAAVFRRAELEFLETGIPGTAGRTGVLIFVSMHERRAVVIGDEAISARMKPEAWVEILDEMIAELRGGSVSKAFVKAIGRVGDVLAREFPIQAGDTNELPNALVIKD